MIKRKQIADCTRQNLIDAFCLLRRDLPLEKLTVSQLTAKAGYERTTFYQYFSNLHDLQYTVQETFTSNRKEKQSR